MEVKIIDTLPDEARYIRTKVFVEEQGFKEEFDSEDKKATHIVLFDEGKAVATCRFFARDDDFLIGRIAVLKEYRGRHIGAMLIKTAEEEIKKKGGRRLAIHSQKRAKDFYIKQGYVAEGEEDFDEGCPHVWVYKNLD